MQYIRPEVLSEAVTTIFVGYGLPARDAAIVAASLVDADVRGVASHGVQRVPSYVAGVKNGSINPRPRIEVVFDDGPRALIDGDDGMGQVGAQAAMNQAVERAVAHGIGAVGLRRSRHCGAMAYWARFAPPKGCIGIATTNAGLNMAPTGGRDRIVGNNPVAIAVPSNRPWPVVLDMATSVVAGGKLDVAAIRGEKIPFGWAIDLDGNPTDDPVVARKGILEPVGGPKGYGLAVMLDVLAGVLTGARFGGGLGPAGSGQFFFALKVDGFLSLEEFNSRIDQVIDQIHDSRLAPGSDRIYFPGEVEHERERVARERGVALEDAVARDLNALLAELGNPERV